MQLTSVRPGDIVKVDKKGRRFFAEVEHKEKQKLTIDPIQRGISYREASAREVVGHWKQMGRNGG